MMKRVSLAAALTVMLACGGSGAALSRSALAGVRALPAMAAFRAARQRPPPV